MEQLTLEQAADYEPPIPEYYEEGEPSAYIEGHKAGFIQGLIGKSSNTKIYYIYLLR
jgi:hypothetical protein